MNDAIKKAIEGGYKVPWNYLIIKDTHANIFLDPLFWRALGKSLGWENRTGLLHDKINDPDWKKADNLIRKSKYHAHRFLDWTMEGKDIDLFFQELIKPQ